MMLLGRVLVGAAYVNLLGTKARHPVDIVALVGSRSFVLRSKRRFPRHPNVVGLSVFMAPSLLVVSRLHSSSDSLAITSPTRSFNGAWSLDVNVCSRSYWLWPLSGFRNPRDGSWRMAAKMKHFNCYVVCTRRRTTRIMSSHPRS